MTKISISLKLIYAAGHNHQTISLSLNYVKQTHRQGTQELSLLDFQN